MDINPLSESDYPSQTFARQLTACLHPHCIEETMVNMVKDEVVEDFVERPVEVDGWPHP